jgi:hypothetical protein
MTPPTPPERYGAAPRGTLAWVVASTGTASAVLIAHAVYGARRYENVALYHVVVVALFWFVLAAVLTGVYAWRPGRVKRGLLVALVALPYVGIFGLAHGGVGHLLKLAFFLAGMAPERLAQTFDVGDFVMPDDAFFEGTGVATFVAGLLVAHALLRFVRGTRAGRSANAAAPVGSLDRESAAVIER